MNQKDYQIFLTGPAGSGVKSTGKLLQKILHNYYHTFGSVGYYSLIKGGRNYFNLRISKHPVASNTSKNDLLIALNKDCLIGYLERLRSKGTVIIDQELFDGLLPSERTKLEKYRVITVPLKELLQKEEVLPISYTLAYIGIVLKAFDISLKKAYAILKKVYSRAPSHIQQSNQKALRIGYNLSTRLKVNLSPIRNETTTEVVDAAYTTAIGFIAAEGKIYTAYPMTPATPILHYLAKLKKKYNLIVRQASTEIEAVGFAIGANWAFTRTLVATSGGGLDLMGEFISMAGMAEIPLVIVNAQRPGPSTGLPTWTDQGDLNLVKGIGHGEFPRIVLAPSDPKEAYLFIQEAFNLADVYQTVVFVLLDKHLTTSLFEVKASDIKKKLPINRGKIDKQPKADANGFYPRYKVTKDGISPRPILKHPQAIYIANSDEHDMYGFSVEAGYERVVQHSKRLLKARTILEREFKLPEKVHSAPHSKVTVVTWGSTKGAVSEAVSQLNREERRITHIHFTWLYPLDFGRLRQYFRKYEKIIVIENNATGQLASRLRQANVEIAKTILKYDGEPFYVDEIYQKLAKMIPLRK